MHGVLLSVQVGELLLLDDLGDRASGAGVDANATSDALVGINYGMSHGSFLSVDRRYRRCAPV